MKLVGGAYRWLIQHILLMPLLLGSIINGRQKSHSRSHSHTTRKINLTESRGNLYRRSTTNIGLNQQHHFLNYNGIKEHIMFAHLLFRLGERNICVDLLL